MNTPSKTRCESCDDRGHVVERWTGRCWITLRGCDACGMRGDVREFVRENIAAMEASR